MNEVCQAAITLGLRLPIWAARVRDSHFMRVECMLRTKPPAPWSAGLLGTAL